MKLKISVKMLRKKLTDEEIREIFLNSDEEVDFVSETSESDSNDELPPNIQTLKKGGDDAGLSATTGTQGNTSNLAEQVISTWTATSPSWTSYHL